MSTTAAPIANYTTEAEGLTFTFTYTFAVARDAYLALAVQASDGQDTVEVGRFELLPGGESTFTAVGAAHPVHLPRWTTTFQLVDQHLAHRVRINFAKVAGRLF